MNSTLITAKAAPKPRVRVYPRLSLEVRQRLSEYRARKGLKERDIIEDAVRQYLDGTSDSAKVLAQLERLALAIDDPVSLRIQGRGDRRRNRRRRCLFQLLNLVDLLCGEASRNEDQDQRPGTERTHC